MLLSAFCSDAGLRMAGALRTELAPFLAADPLHPLRPELLQAAYRMLRCAENLECYSALHENLLKAKIIDFSADCSAVIHAAQEVLCSAPNNLRFNHYTAALPVAVNQSALITVLLNLICNSLLYGGAHPVISIHIMRQGGRAVLILSDNGPGIPLHRQHRALQPFESNSHLPSFGLGLPLAILFARRFKGTFTIESQPGKGLRAALSLPLCNTAKTPTPLDSAALLADRFSPIYTQLSPRCILPE